MLLQAIPVLHFFSAKKAVFYSYIDEEKPEQKSKVEKEEYQKNGVMAPHSFTEKESARSFSPFVQKHHVSPLLEFLTPPPDVC
jgi:hypothetical protein